MEELWKCITIGVVGCIIGLFIAGSIVDCTRRNNIENGYIDYDGNIYSISQETDIIRTKQMAIDNINDRAFIKEIE